MFRFEVRGYIREGGDAIPFVIITPPCMNTYQAALYVTGKLTGTNIAIDHSATARVID